MCVCVHVFMFVSAYTLLLQTLSLPSPPPSSPSFLSPPSLPSSSTLFPPPLPFPLQCDGTTVVARSMVFLECSMFVRNLCSQTLNPPCTVWVNHNSDSPRMHNVATNLRKWAEAIGEKLRLMELRDREMFARFQASRKDGETVILPEEPTFPDENEVTPTNHTPSTSDVGLSVSYALKMAACNLLLEITKFLRDIPPHFSPGPSVSQVGTPLLSHTHTLDRRGSYTSIGSSDAESTHHRVAPLEFTFKNSLSVDEPHEPHEPHEPPDFMDEYNVMSPRTTHRTSFYLHINTNITSGGSLSRNTSFKKPSRTLRIADTPTDGRARAFPTSPAARNRRKSISSAVMPRPRRPSFLVVNNNSSSGFLSSSQPQGGGVSSAYLKKRRQSMGAIFSQRQESMDYAPPATPSTPHPFQSFLHTGGRTTSGGAASSISNSLNISFTKLKRGMRGAFRRHGAKTKTTSDLSPNASPATLHRKRSRRLSTADGGHSVFISSSDEKLPYSYPWLDTIEHFILKDTKETTLHNQQSCQKLIAALKKVYSRHCAGEEEEEEEVGGGNNKKPFTLKHSTSSLGGIFIHRFPIEETAQTINRVQSVPAEVQARIDRRASLRPPPRSTSLQFPSSQGEIGVHRSSSTTSSALSKLSFANVSSLLATRTLSGGVGNGETIQLTIEADSPFEKSYLTAKQDKDRTKYIDLDFSGLIHVPFSTVVYAAPILNSRTFSSLKGVAWDALLSRDQDLSQVAAAFFLLACAKETDKTVKRFVTKKVLNQGAKEQRKAILRFKVLWDCRYGVWPRMEERAQKRMNLNDSKKVPPSSLSFSLTSPFSLPHLPSLPPPSLHLSPSPPSSLSL